MAVLSRVRANRCLRKFTAGCLADLARTGRRAMMMVRLREAEGEGLLEAVLRARLQKMETSGARRPGIVISMVRRHLTMSRGESAFPRFLVRSRNASSCKAASPTVIG